MGLLVDFFLAGQASWDLSVSGQWRWKDERSKCSDVLGEEKGSAFLQ